MKTTITNLLTAICISGLLLSAAAQPAALLPGAAAVAAPDQPAPPPDATAAGAAAVTDAAPPTAVTPPDVGVPNDASAVPVPAPAAVVITPRGNAPTAESVPSLFTPPTEPIGTNQNDLTLSYNRAPLEMVLSYLSDAAGYIVVMDVQPRNAYITVKGSHLTKDEAVDLLNAELNRNNYAAVKSGDRTLTIMTKDEARTRMIPVKSGNNWREIPDNAEIATWIIPIQFVDAGQLVTELQSFVSMQATIVADPNGNSVIITDTQANIRHLGQIMKMVDDSAKTETVVKTFKLDFASPVDVANELTSLFPSSNGGGGGGFQVAGGRGGGGGIAALFGGGNRGGGGAGTTSQRVQKAQQINVVPDTRLSAVVVTAPQDMMDQISALMVKLDVVSERDQDHPVAYQLKNADPNEVVATLQSVFGSTSTRTGSSANSALQQRSQNAISSLGTATVSTGISTSTTGR